MKQRRRLLFGLGILVSLSMAVPAYAADATQGTAQVSESVQEVLQDEENVEVPGTENEEGGTVDAADPTDGQDENSNGQQADSEDAATATGKEWMARDRREYLDLLRSERQPGLYENRYADHRR